MKRIILIILSIIMILPLFVACNEGDKPDVTTTDVEADTTTEPEIVEADPPVLSKNGVVQYKIVRHDGLSTKTVNTITNFFKTLSNMSSERVEYSDDVVARGTDPNNDKFEILIGATNRRESEEVFASLNAFDWAVESVGNKIVIVGGCESSTVLALNWFLNYVMPGTKNADGTITLDELKTPHRVLKEYKAEGLKVCGMPVSEYKILYSAAATEDAITTAGAISDGLASATGKLLTSIRASAVNETEREILIGSTARSRSGELMKECSDVMDYKVLVENGKVYIVGGSGWAMAYAAELLVKNISEGLIDLPEGYKLEGTAQGNYVVPLESGANLRIMTNNVWSNENNQPAWEAIGENCSAAVRSVGFANVYVTYMPDVICFQEMSVSMVSKIRTAMEKYGVSYSLLTFAPEMTDATCILYNPKTVKLIDKGHHIFTYGCNSNSKGYTWGYFEHLATGKKFVALSTHMWWMSESNQPGSNEWRRKQAVEIATLTKNLAEKYSCPVFVQGDMNTQTTSTAFKEYKDAGFENCHDIATVYADNRRGMHTCNADGFNTTMSSGTYTEKAIDHMIIYNRGAIEIKVFDHVVTDFYYKLSDHFPLYIDAVLG